LSAYLQNNDLAVTRKAVTVPGMAELRARGKKVSMLTCCDAIFCDADESLQC
jgi:hypothetical protein